MSGLITQFAADGDVIKANKALGTFHEVRIVSIDDSRITGDNTTKAVSTGVSFKVVVTK